MNRTFHIKVMTNKYLSFYVTKTSLDGWIGSLLIELPKGCPRVLASISRYFSDTVLF